MSKRFRFTYSKQEYGYICFTAETLQEAESLFAQVQDRTLDEEHLPEVYIIPKGGERDFDDLEDLDEEDEE